MKKAVLIILSVLVMAGSVFAQTENDFDIMQLSDGTLAITYYRGYRSNLENVVVPSTIEGIRVTRINDIHGDNIKSITLPNSVTSIGSGAFHENKNLERVTGNGVIRLERGAFEHCSNLVSVIMDNLSVIGDYAFFECRKLRYVSMNKLTSIGDSAFFNCPLDIITIPNSLTNIHKETA